MDAGLWVGFALSKAGVNKSEHEPVSRGDVMNRRGSRNSLWSVLVGLFAPFSKCVVTNLP